MPNLVVTDTGTAAWGADRLSCAIGRGGVGTAKREGDGVTPVGRFRLTTVLYRPDRRAAPSTRLPVRALRPHDGWCDAPDHPDYNHPIGLPFEASHERMWRDDDLYDLLAVSDQNQRPCRPGAGSAIFLHLARGGYAPTAGCVAFAATDLVTILAGWTSDSRLVVLPPSI